MYEHHLTVYMSSWISVTDCEREQVKNNVCVRERENMRVRVYVQYTYT
jgi:hypothetical protein